MEGYRLIALPTPDAPVPDETGSRRHFSDTLARTRWWEERLHMEAGTGWFPQAEDALWNGYAIVQVGTEGVEEDNKGHKSPEGKDWIGRIISARPIKVVRHVSPKQPYPKISFWGKIKCCFGIHLPCQGIDEYDFTTSTVVRNRTCWICHKEIRQESKFS